MYKKCVDLGFSEKEISSEKLNKIQKYRLECPFGHIFTFREDTQNPSNSPLKTLNTCLVVSDALKALSFYQKVFSGSQGEYIDEESKIAYCELITSGNVIGIADEETNKEAKSPKSLGETSFETLITVQDFDDQFQVCTSQGFTIL